MNFPYSYVGGGYFRRKGVPVGQKAEIVHGMEAIERAWEMAIESVRRSDETGTTGGPSISTPARNREPLDPLQMDPLNQVCDPPAMEQETMGTGSGKSES
jgi:hypothetical protein